MRALKTILIIILALAVVLVILAYTGPERSTAQRSVLIEARPETVYPYIASLRNQHEWGVWKDMEAGQQNEWTGTDATVGSTQSWKGDTVGIGSQRIVAMEENRKVKSELVFVEPWESTVDVDLELIPEGEATRAQWTMTQENKGMGRLMAVFMDMDKMIGPDLERGLQNLKTMAESDQQAQDDALNAKTHRGYVIETVERPAITYLGKRAKVKWSALEQFFGTNFSGAYGVVMANNIQPAGQPSAIFFEWDEQNQMADLMAGIPVATTEEVKVKGFETYTVPASKMLHIPYYGAYDKSEEAHLAMDEMIKANGLTHYGNVIEEYITDPTTEPDTSKWLTNIYYMIR